ncbi:zinc finger protein 700-like [Pollicipes pollicipes]|uniref:zinc finger protein 700-like n=1 Tax=Pollicipes pollicipes TaxID=41117 RepID=UPI001884B017|nr:zinc finger protein 700-like [Pollicipes pollicipes]XP_037076061.1 zinc finger protein 700-like [Pollicipes pollicipes]XP_037076062.1 zinc finger protein 700-like [Pollicipes pollicipes]XP_037076063.1 zinc finger protein 700-like [Pollicipes pollicipes]XP_037076065.1 zinc finger protein 700-like [Pollicipes pollicipes]XP_037076066.1 zinc finger protein 700-like [Pollicipes pollicipes]
MKKSANQVQKKAHSGKKMKSLVKQKSGKVNLRTMAHCEKNKRTSSTSKTCGSKCIKPKTFTKAKIPEKKSAKRLQSMLDSSCQNISNQEFLTPQHIRNSSIKPWTAGLKAPGSKLEVNTTMLHGTSIWSMLEKLLQAVKNLGQLDCFLAIMDMEIQFSSKLDGHFLPEKEEWSVIQEHLLCLDTCLQALRQLVDCKHSDHSSKAGNENPTSIQSEVGGAPCERPPSEDGDDPDSPLAEPSASPEPSAGRDDGGDSDDGGKDGGTGGGVDNDDDWPAEDAAERFPCTAGCKGRSGGARLFPSEKSRRMHLAAQHGQRAGRGYPEYICPICRAVQKRPGELAAHIVANHDSARPAPAAAAAGSPFVMCRLCHGCFPGAEQLGVHACQYADGGGVVQELIRRGVLMLSGAELTQLHRFVCHQCDEEFRNVDIFRVHLQYCGPPPYPCQLCGEMCRTGRQLVRHKMTRHRDRDQALFFCPAPGCAQGFRRNAAFQKHLVRQHASRGPAQPYGCDACDKKFIKKIYLTHHKLRFHHDTLRRDFVCDVCGARLGSSSALNVHVVSVHQKPTHRCSVCGKAFARQDRLRNHARIHTGEKPYSCTLCPMAFSQQCKLNDHLRRHRGEKRFRCVMCDKMYAASCDLRAHLRRVHSVDMVNRTHTIQPVSALLRPLPPAETEPPDAPQPEPEPEPEPDPEPDPEPQQGPEPEPELPPQAQPPPLPQQQQQQQDVSLAAAVQQSMHNVQLQPVQVAAPAQTLHVQELAQLGRSVILIPAVDPSGGTAFYPILNQ